MDLHEHHPLSRWFEKIILVPVYFKLYREKYLVSKSNLFDCEWYLSNYPDVAVSGIDPIRHYLTFGWKEGRNPSDDFNTLGYLVGNPHLKSTGVNPLVHYIRSRNRNEPTKNYDDLTPIVFIEHPRENQVISNEILLSGWILTKNGHPSLTIIIDGHIIETDIIRSSRQDIVNTLQRFKDTNTHPGFSAIIKQTQFSLGIFHTLEVMADEDGNVGSCSVTIRSNLYDRKFKLTRSINIPEQEGLEIGPLDKPLVTKQESNNKVHYVDHCSTDELKEKYRDDPNVRQDDVVNVDFVFLEKTLKEVVNGTMFDYAIASHVIEHVPDVLWWLKEIAEVLKDGGVLSLAIPDKRFTFDILREVTTSGKMLEAYLQHQRRPSPMDLFDHKSLQTNVDLVEVWKGSVNIANLKPTNTLIDAYEKSLMCFHDEKYYDVHVHVFTPTSFLNILETFTRIGLLDYRIREFQPTLPYTHEFSVLLERKPRQITTSEYITTQLEDIKQARENLNNLVVN